MVRLMRHHHEAKAVPALDIVKDGDALGLQTPDKINPTLNAMRMVEALGVQSDHFLNARINELSRYHGSHGGSLDSQAISDAFALIAGANATDPVQSALLTQMHCTHDAAIRALSHIGKSQYTPQVQVWGNLGVKLLNAYARQAEVLAKLQRGGEQVIKHIHIDNRGGQALLAEQVVTGGMGAKSEDQAYGQSAHGPALLGSDPFGRVVPMPSREGTEAVPVTRLRPRKRRAEG
ncbi:MAG: hypothetical protein WBL74_07030 [Novosphingobium sp.]|uniref:hypothetical protein n=1 Tax=Novosphingobium sp. TaxID=1874826 RepID=UPI003C7B4463